MNTGLTIEELAETNIKKEDLIELGAKPLEGFPDYFFLETGKEKLIYAPDFGGTYYLRNSIDID